MRICVVGAGSLGGHLAVLLANAGHDISIIARGAHLDAIREAGLRLVLADGSERVARGIAASDRIASAGPQDLVILAVKANQVEAIVDELPALFDDATVLMPIQNGIPWWYFQRHGGPHEGRCVRAVDPQAHLMHTIDPRRIVGSVVYPAASITEPGVVRHIEGDRYPLGELDGTTTERISRIAEAFADAGLTRSRQHPRGDLAEAVGQRDLQSDQRADARDARRHLPVPADARARVRDDARGAGSRRAAGAGSGTVLPRPTAIHAVAPGGQRDGTITSRPVPDSAPHASPARPSIWRTSAPGLFDG